MFLECFQPHQELTFPRYLSSTYSETVPIYAPRKANEPVELLVFYIIFNQNTLTGLFSFNNQKRLRFWTIFIFASLNVY